MGWYCSGALGVGQRGRYGVSEVLETLAALASELLQAVEIADWEAVAAIDARCRPAVDASVALAEADPDVKARVVVLLEALHEAQQYASSRCAASRDALAAEIRKLDHGRQLLRVYDR